MAHCVLELHELELKIVRLVRLFMRKLCETNVNWKMSEKSTFKQQNAVQLSIVK